MLILLFPACTENKKLIYWLCERCHPSLASSLVVSPPVSLSVYISACLSAGSCSTKPMLSESRICRRLFSLCHVKPGSRMSRGFEKIGFVGTQTEGVWLSAQIQRLNPEVGTHSQTCRFRNLNIFYKIFRVFFNGHKIKTSISDKHNLKIDVGDVVWVWILFVTSHAQ